jgi:SAM-dependent methyltransferase
MTIKETELVNYGELYDYYQGVVYDRAVLCTSLIGLVDFDRPKRVLDCACGTGLPALDLAERGLDVECTDGSEAMALQFNRNAVRRGVQARAKVRKWVELPLSYEGAFDFVMCRGNSLIYCDTWLDCDGPPARQSVLIENIQAIRRCVSPGGTLLVDIAEATVGSTARRFAEKLIEGRRVCVQEEVRVEGARREWTHTIEVDGVPYTHSFRSSSLGPSELKEALYSIGAVSVERVVVAGERPSYVVFRVRFES